MPPSALTVFFRPRDARRDTLVVQALVGLPATGAIGPADREYMAQLASDVLAGSQTSEGQYPGYPVEEACA